MKKFISMMLVLTLLGSLFSVTSFADAKSDIEVMSKIADKLFDTSDDMDVQVFFSAATYELLRRKIISVEQCNEILSIIQSPDKNTYTFGKGTFIVGTDLKAGTYNIFCESTDQDDYSDSISSFGDLYTQYGMQEYADAFSSIGGLADSMKSITVTTYSSRGLMDKYYTLKNNESARIILTDGMQLEISGGTARLEFVR